MLYMSKFGICVNPARLGSVFNSCRLILKMSGSANSNNVSVEAENRKRSLHSEEDTEAKKQKIDSERIKRRKVALLLTYSGQGYLGMQRNPGMKTIEEDLLGAMLKAGVITEEAYNTPQTIQFQRAARTDKGVSAARQVVSLKLPEDAKVEAINEHLPEQIRVLAIKRATKSFNSKSCCDARTYSYMLPTFALAPPSEEPNENYRITSEVMEQVNKTLKAFEGTHNFHNFTSRKKPLDPSAKRYILNFNLGEPFLKENMEFAVMKVKGQSFMLHQIRKMVGLTIALARGHTSMEILERAWKTERLDLPCAPSPGLVLEEVHYDRYNQRFGKDGIHEPLDWSDVEEQVKIFKEKFIYPRIVEAEITEKSMLEWMQTLPLHSYTVREEHINMCHGLHTLGEAVEMLEDAASAATSDGLDTLARAAQAIQEDQKENTSLYNGSPNHMPPT